MTTATAPTRSITIPHRVDRRWALAAVVIGWIVICALFNGQLNMATGGSTTVQDWLKSVVEWADANRDSSPIFVYFINYIGDFIGWYIDQVAWVIANLGWTGVTAVAVAVAMVFANWKIAVLTGVGFIGFGVLGVWDESMLTLGFIVVAVSLSLLIGIPLGILAGISDRFNRWVTPVLDFMQIMPT
ncbi:MAG TPA: ABC transporter permease, partial [Actinomycetes bacterium]|nr:ABC transporter permease [Actinomycetes bacterium]